MYKFSLLSLVTVSFLVACKPTPRTAGRGDAQKQEAAAAVEEPKAPAEAPKPMPSPLDSLLSVSVTQQSYNQVMPWNKSDASTSSSCGVYLGDGKVLTVAGSLKDATLIELVLPDTSRSVTAKVEKVDYDANLALLTLMNESDKDFWDSRVALPLGKPLSLNEPVDVWSYTRSGLALVNSGRAESAAASGAGLPQVNIKMAQNLSDAKGGMPVVVDRRLAGIATGYTAGSQLLTALDEEVISRFLSQPAKGYPGIAVHGIQSVNLIDPVFRRYLKLDEKGGGVYVSKVQKGSAAEQAGIKEGDVIESVDGLAVDARGLVNHPRLGPLSWSAVFRGRGNVGESMKMGLRRDGHPVAVDVPLNRDAINKDLLPDEESGTAPEYIIHGGLVFQECTRPYLSALQRAGGNMMPIPFLKIDQEKERYMKEGRRRLVVLSLVIPTPATLGYDRYRFCVVDAINGKPVKDLHDAAKLLDEKTPDGITTLSINKAPYKVYISQEAVKSANAAVKRGAIPVLRRLNEEAPVAAK